MTDGTRGRDLARLRTDGVRVDSPRDDIAWSHPRERHGLFVELRHRERYDYTTSPP